MIFSPSRFAVMAACALPLLAPLFHAPAHAQQTPRVLSEAATEGMRLRIERAPQHGLVAAPLDIAALRLNGSLHKPRVLGSDGAEILSQWVPESGVSSRGLLLLQLPRGGNFDLQVRAGEAINTLAPAPQTFVARNSQAELAFDAAREGGFPSRISYLKSGRTIEGFLWRDRIYNGTEYSLRHDKNARLEYAAEGPLATVVRNRARYVAENGAAPASAPEATYTWILWKAQPLIEVRALATQSRATRWNEAHFLEFHFNDASFDRFLGGEPTRSETLKADKKGHEFGQWGALRIGDDVLAQVGKRAIIYDGRGDYGTYLLLGNPAPFAPWNDTTRTAAATFFIGTEAAAETALPRMAQENAAAPRVLATANAFEARLQKLRAQAARQAPSQKRETLWRIALAERALFSGDETRASAWLGTTSPADSSHIAPEILASRCVARRAACNWKAFSI